MENNERCAGGNYHCFDREVMDGVKNQHQLNTEIEQFIEQKDKQGQLYSKDEIAYIYQYEGSGGLVKEGARGAGILHEFYTPDWVCELMWKLAYKHGFKGGHVLDPSCGTGRFFQYAPDQYKCIGFEINKTAARIANLRYMGANVYNQYFETAFLEEPRFTKRQPGFKTWLKQYPFNLVIGNPPYGVYKSYYSSFFKSPSFAQVEQFFMYYSMQLLKPGGLLVFITSSNFLRNGNTYNEAKEKISEIADFVEAPVRLPGVFKSTDIPTDILIFRRK